MKKIKLFLFALLSLSTLIGFSQVDTIIVTPNSPSYLLLQFPDSLGFNAKVSVRQPAPSYPAYECGVPTVTLESSMTPIAIAIVYGDDAATQWRSTQFLFNLPYNGDSLDFCVNYVEDCNCAIDPMYDTDGDGIICNTMWNSIPDTIPNDIVGAWIYKLQCTTDVSELTNNINVCPNPVTNQITLEKIGNVVIYSSNGRLVKTVRNEKVIDVSDLPNGLYLGFINGEKFNFIKN